LRNILLFLSLIVIILSVSCTGRKKSEMRIADLRCEYLINPVGIGEPQPRLSWILDSARRGQKQTAWRVLVSSSREKLERDQGNLWDTGKVDGDQTAQVVYSGAGLKSAQECFWKVCAWDVDGVQTEFSPVASWSMGLLAGSDWKGKWIAMPAVEKAEDAAGQEIETGPPPAWIRKAFSVDKPVRRAIIYATARGIFELYLNGSRVSPDVFAPEWTDYDKRIQYRAYDLTEMLAQGGNALGIVLGDGWYSGYVGWRGRGAYGRQNSVLAQLELECEDGSRQTIGTDESWRCNSGPLLSADLMMGESYDARLELTGWDSAGYDDSSWQPVAVVEKPEVPLVAQHSQPVRVTEEIETVAVFQPRPGVYVFDLGQNIAGRARLRVKGKAGTKVVLRHAERLNPDSTIYTTNLRRARATDTYILKSGGEEIYEPRFTFHGFQYVEVTGFPGVPDKSAITGCVLNSDTPQVGTFKCSNPMVNQLWRNILWGQRGNFLSVPTDCPQRDERLGWMGDAQIFIRTATFNMDVAAFFSKWMYDVDDAQSEEGAFSEISPRFGSLEKHCGAAGWADAGVIVPWTVYQVYGDTRIIERHYGSMSRWMDYVLRDNPDLIRKNGRGSDYGDWLSIDADTPKEILATAYWAHDARLMSRMAAATGRTEDQRRYEELFEGIRAAFQKAYISPDGHILGETQTGYLLALYMDLLPESLRQAAGEHLVENIRQKDWHLSTGFLGVRHLNPVLTGLGYKDVAYRLLNTDTFPSWLYPIRNGATTIWERWDGWTQEKGFQDPGMNSFNHYSLGSVGEWLYGSVAGIDLDPEVSGFKSIVIRPCPGGGLEYASAEYESIRGMIKSAWRLEGDSLALDVTVPANAHATVYFPCPKNVPVTESGGEAGNSEGVTALGRQGDRAVFGVESGEYHFKGVPAI